MDESLEIQFLRIAAVSSELKVSNPKKQYDSRNYFPIISLWFSRMFFAVPFLFTNSNIDIAYQPS